MKNSTQMNEIISKISIEIKGALPCKQTWDLIFKLYEKETAELCFKSKIEIKTEKFSLFASKGITGSKGTDGKFFDICFPKESKLACYSNDGIITKPLHAMYDTDADVLKIYFVEQSLYKQRKFKANLQSSHKPYKYDIFVDLDNEDNIMAIVFSSASNLLEHLPA